MRLALLVACSVENPGRGKSANADFKTSMSQFAQIPGATDTRVRRHLEAWNKAAEKDPTVKASQDLTPDDASNPALVVPSEDDFGEEYDSGAHDPSPKRIAHVLEDPEKRKKVLATLPAETLDELREEAFEQKYGHKVDDVVRATERHEPSPGFELEMRIKADLDHMARDGQWNHIQRVVTYGQGLLEGHSAQDSPRRCSHERLPH